MRQGKTGAAPLSAVPAAAPRGARVVAASGQPPPIAPAAPRALFPCSLGFNLVSLLSDALCWPHGDSAAAGTAPWPSQRGKGIPRAGLSAREEQPGPAAGRASRPPEPGLEKERFVVGVRDGSPFLPPGAAEPDRDCCTSQPRVERDPPSGTCCSRSAKAIPSTAEPSENRKVLLSSRLSEDQRMESCSPVTNLGAATGLSHLQYRCRDWGNLSSK